MLLLMMAMHSTAMAQDIPDVHALHPTPGGGQTGDFIATWAPKSHDADPWAATALYEYAEWSLIRWLNDEDALGDDLLEPGIDYISAVHLGFRYALHDKVGVGISVPLWVLPVFSDGLGNPGVGDMRLGLPVDLKPQGAEGWGLSVVPHFQLPTGDEALGLGESTIRSGALVAASHVQGPWTLVGNVGSESGMGTATSPTFLATIGGSRRMVGDVTMALELMSMRSLGSAGAATPGPQTEALFSAHGRLQERTLWTLGAARGLAAGTSTPLYRLFAGLTLSPPLSAPAPEPEQVNGTVRVITRTVNGDPINATVRMNGDNVLPPTSLGEDGRGEYTLSTGAWRILITAPSFETIVLDIELQHGRSDVYIIEVVLQPSRVEVKDNEIQIKEKIHFAFDEAKIEASSMDLLREVAATLIAEDWITEVEVQGYTDAKGDTDYNLALSQRRVEAVRDTIISFGVDGDRLVAKGYGEARPIASNDTEEGRALNRRVQFMIIKKRE
jgi:outer membrane protein OmpA-like peptidoglycan-associated protein